MPHFGLEKSLPKQAMLEQPSEDDQTAKTYFFKVLGNQIPRIFSNCHNDRNIKTFKCQTTFLNILQALI